MLLAGELVELKAFCDKMWQGTSTSGTASIPAMHAVMKQATVPAIIALKAPLAISFFLEGAMLARKKSKVCIKKKVGYQEKNSSLRE